MGTPTQGTFDSFPMSFLGIRIWRFEPWLPGQKQEHAVRLCTMNKNQGRIPSQTDIPYISTILYHTIQHISTRYTRTSSPGTSLVHALSGHASPPNKSRPLSTLAMRPPGACLSTYARADPDGPRRFFFFFLSSRAPHCGGNSPNPPRQNFNTHLDTWYYCDGTDSCSLAFCCPFHR